MSKLFDHTAFICRDAVNIKLSILKAIQQIVNDAEIFTASYLNKENNYLPDSHLYDAIEPEFGNLPGFGVDFAGYTRSDSELRIHDPIYMLAYRGKVNKMKEKSLAEVVESELTLVTIVHDTILRGLEEMSDKNRLKLFDFSRDYQAPSETQRRITMNLIESMFPSSSEMARTNAINWMYAVVLDRG
jgi:hypothetical protein